MRLRTYFVVDVPVVTSKRYRFGVTPRRNRDSPARCLVRRSQVNAFDDLWPDGQHIRSSGKI